MVETQKGAAQLPVRRGCRQRIAQSSQQPLMNELLLCNARERAASRLFEGRISETCEGDRRRLLAAGKDLQQLGKRLGLRISEPERLGEGHGWNRVGEPKANLLVDWSGHGGIPLADAIAVDSVRSPIAEL